MQIGYVPAGYTATTAANQCKRWAASNADKFSSQVAGAVWGTSDYTVAPAYGPLAAAAFRQIYGGSFTEGSQVSVTGGGTNTPYRMVMASCGLTRYLLLAWPTHGLLELEETIHTMSMLRV